MTAERLFWLSGLALVAGGGLASTAWILFALRDPDHLRYGDRLWLPLNVLVIFGGVFMAMGLPGFYAWQAEQAGIFGLIAFVLFFTGILIPYVAVHAVETVTMPNIPAGMMTLVSIGAPSLFIGALLMGIVTWRAAVYQPWLGILLVISVLLGLVAQIAPSPAWLGRNLSSVGFTGTMIVMGLSLMARSG